MKIINGKQLSKIITEELKSFFQKSPDKYTISIIQVGDDLASSLFINLKKRKAEEFGIIIDHKLFSNGVADEEIISYIKNCNENADVKGIMVQSPTPNNNFKKISSYIKRNKDIDGLNYQIASIVKPAVVEAIEIVLKEILGDLHHVRSKHIVIINDSIILGRPLAQALLDLDATVTIANKYTHKLPEICKNSDIIISASGVSNLVKKEWIHKEHILIDCGSPYPEFEPSCSDIVMAITPVPGGIGPLTVTSLYSNLKKLIENT